MPVQPKGEGEKDKGVKRWDEWEKPESERRRDQITRGKGERPAEKRRRKGETQQRRRKDGRVCVCDAGRTTGAEGRGEEGD